MGKLVDALKSSQTNSDNWYKVVNYPESHDEVGNVNDRIVNVAGFGQGLRRNKVAPAANGAFPCGLWAPNQESGSSSPSRGTKLWTWIGISGSRLAARCSPGGISCVN